MSQRLMPIVAFGNEVIEGDTGAFDRAVLLALRDPADLAVPIGPRWLAGAAQDVTGLGGPVVLTFVTVAIAGFLLVIRRPADAVLIAASVGGGSLLSTVFKIAFDRPRPDLVPHAVAIASASFPSGHAMLSAVAYLTVGGLLMRVQPPRPFRSRNASTSTIVMAAIEDFSAPKYPRKFSTCQRWAARVLGDKPRSSR